MRLILIFGAIIALSFANVVQKNSLTETNYGAFLDQIRQNNQIKFQELLTTLGRNESASSRAITAILNDYADQIFANLQNFVINAGLDPIELPDIIEDFSYTILFVTWHGEFELKSGWLQGLASMHRMGDVVAEYDTNTEVYKLTITFGFDDFLFNYDYTAQIMNLGPTGGIDGKISDLEIKVVLAFDFTQYQAKLDTFDIVNSGNITFKFTGNSLVDWLLNILSSLFLTIMKRVILAIIENVIHGSLTDMIDAINDFINSILNPTTSTTSVSTIMSIS